MRWGGFSITSKVLNRRAIKFRIREPRENDMPFTDRSEAGRKLAEALAKYRDQDVVVLALPRGGLPVAKEIAAALGASLDLVLVRKVGVPWQPELAMGAVVDGATPLTVRNEDVIKLAGVTAAGFAAVRDRELAEIQRRRVLYLGGRPHPELRDRIVIVVDDGIATGATTRAALRAVRKRKPKKLILAVPVAPTSTLSELRDEADEIVCLEDHEAFGAIGFFYSDFSQVSDDEVKDILAAFPVQTVKA
jgi:putative phosphoribosyl transferase